MNQLDKDFSAPVWWIISKMTFVQYDDFIFFLKKVYNNLKIIRIITTFGVMQWY